MVKSAARRSANAKQRRWIVLAVVTVLPEVSFTLNGEETEAATRLTLVFLKTSEGWKIVHEHGTPKSCFEQGSGK